jgi:hypothetical protein
MATARVQFTFFWLVVAQALHSFEEYRGRLYEGFLPARIVSGLISSDLRWGFVVFNVAFVTSRTSCGAPLRRGGSWPI